MITAFITNVFCYHKAICFAENLWNMQDCADEESAESQGNKQHSSATHSKVS